MPPGLLGFCGLWRSCWAAQPETDGVGADCFAWSPSPAAVRGVGEVLVVEGGRRGDELGGFPGRRRWGDELGGFRVPAKLERRGGAGEFGE